MTELTLSVSILVASVERPLSCIYAVMASTPVSYRTDKAGVGIASVVNRILLCYFDKKLFCPFHDSGNFQDRNNWLPRSCRNGNVPERLCSDDNWDNANNDDNHDQCRR